MLDVLLHFARRDPRGFAGAGTFGFADASRRRSPPRSGSIGGRPATTKFRSDPRTAWVAHSSAGAPADHQISAEGLATLAPVRRAFCSAWPVATALGALLWCALFLFAEAMW